MPSTKRAGSCKEPVTARSSHHATLYSTKPFFIIVILLKYTTSMKARESHRVQQHTCLQHRRTQRIRMQRKTTKARRTSKQHRRRKTTKENQSLRRRTLTRLNMMIMSGYLQKIMTSQTQKKTITTTLTLLKSQNDIF